MDRMLDSSRVRAAIIQDLPADAFVRRPALALLFIPLLLAAGASIWAILELQLPWYGKGAVALLLGQLLAANAMLGHEAMHGSLVRSRWLQDVLGFIGFGPLLIAPPLWRVWHNKIHHGFTNVGNRDPDGFGTLKRFERMASTRFVGRLAPGTGHPVSYLFIFYWFILHGQIVLWIQAKYARSFAGFKRGSSIGLSLVALAAYVGLGWLAGPWNSLFVIAIPLAGGCGTLMSYIATNHFMRPHTVDNNPIENSMSVRVPRWVDVLHLNFSHHVEHHLFPRMNFTQTPLLRRWLRQHVGDRYLAPPHWLALVELYRSPRFYADAHTLVDPHQRDRRAETADIARRLACATFPEEQPAGPDPRLWADASERLSVDCTRASSGAMNG